MNFKPWMGELAQWGVIFFRDIFKSGVEKEVNSGRGFGDEAAKEKCVQQARKKSLINQAALNRLRDIEVWLKEQGSIFFRNYCRVVQEMEKDAKPPVKKTTTGSGKNKKVEEESNPNWISPGTQFVADLAATQNPDEVQRQLDAVDVFQLDPDGGIRSFLAFGAWLQKKNRQNGYTQKVWGAGEKAGEKTKKAAEATIKGVKKTAAAVKSEAIAASEPTGIFLKRLAILGGCILFGLLFTGIGLVAYLMN